MKVVLDGSSDHDIRLLGVGATKARWWNIATSIVHIVPTPDLDSGISGSSGIRGLKFRAIVQIVDCPTELRPGHDFARVIRNTVDPAAPDAN